jgi:hypothetical protein
MRTRAGEGMRRRSRPCGAGWGPVALWRVCRAKDRVTAELEWCVEVVVEASFPSATIAKGGHPEQRATRGPLEVLFVRGGE